MFKPFFNKYFALFVIAVILYFTHALVTLQGVYGDGNGYYSYANSMYFQGNLNLNPVYDYLSNFNGTKYIFSRIFWDRNYNPFTIGTAITWLPSFGFVSLINLLLNLNLSRFSLIYEIGPGISGILCVLTGLYYLEKYLLKLYKKDVVRYVILGLFFTTNIFYYTALEPALSHQPSFLIICFLLWWTDKFTKKSKNIFIFGLLSGFLATIRMSDSVLLIPFLIKIKPSLRQSLLMLTGVLVGFSPQLINQYLMFGSIAKNPYFSGLNGSWTFGLIRIWEVLFSPRRGLLLWSPLFTLGVAGLIKSKEWVYMFSIIIMLLLVSSWSAYLSAGFGGRMFFATIPFLSIGIAYFFNKLKINQIILFIIFCGVWNFLLIKDIYLHKDLFIQSSDFNITQFLHYMVILR